MVERSGCFSRGPKFHSYQPHGCSQPPLMGFEAFLCFADLQEDRALKFINKQIILKNAL